MVGAPRIPTESFFDNPVAASASISPDGRRIAYLAPKHDRMNVWVRGIDDADAVCVTHDDNRGIRRYMWTDDPRWLIYAQDRDGDENWHLYRVDLDDPEAAAVDLTPFPGAMVLGFTQPGGLPGTLYATMNHRDPMRFDVHRIDIATGEVVVVAENPGDVAVWFWGRNGELFALVSPPEGGMQILAWDEGARQGRLVTSHAGADVPLGIAPIQVTPDGSGIWTGSYRDSDQIQLVRVDVETGEETLVHCHPQLDMDPRSAVSADSPSALIVSRRSGELLAIRYLGERQEIQVLDAGFAEVLDGISALSAGDLKSISSDLDERRWVVSFTHDTDPDATYLYDHETGRSELLFRPFPHLDPAALAPMGPVTVESRDGWPLQCYLTTPVGVEATQLPLVLMVHGGPWNRDGWGYDSRVQFLANRGYAVLQVNMRGSLGFGRGFMHAAIGEFAGAMHDDLIDAVDWAVERGIADPERVGIFGGSYGGYAALVGITFTPDVFAAAVDYCGISNLVSFMRTLPGYTRNLTANNWMLYVGDPDDPDQARDMLSRSPISRVDQVVTPLMVVQGANDVRVVQAESDNMVEALRARGVHVEYMVKENEGHGFQNPENVIDMLNGMQTFFDRHLGAMTRKAAHD